MLIAWLTAAGLVHDPAWLDRSVDPCGDLYTYACAGWQKKNPIPDDKSSWSSYNKLQEENLALLRRILETTPNAQLANAYAACMDEGKDGLTALRPLLHRIALAPDLPELLAELHLDGVAGAGFSFDAQQDYRDAARWVAALDQDGLGLPDRDYYFKNDPRSRELRQLYQAHVAQMLALSGATGAADVMRIESALAKASMTAVQRTDSKNLDHWTAQLSGKGFAWTRYFVASGVAPVGLNLASPHFVSTFEGVARDPAFRTYLRWHALHTFASFLGPPFAEAHFAFFGKKLRGAQKMLPRWKLCVRVVDEGLGELLGQEFVSQHFPSSARARVSTMVQAVSEAMRERLQTLPWMGETTRKVALEKLAKMQNKIGYPDKVRDYSSVQIARGDLLSNLRSMHAFERRRQLRKIGTAVEHGEWEMTAPTVDAYYNAQLNDMNFPAGVLLPPLFDPNGDDAANYGNTGATIGHELTHGFDSDGRQFDSVGNLRDWWTAQDQKRFKQKAQCVVKQYGAYEAAPQVRVDGELTLGENIADLGGAILAYEAWKKQPSYNIDDAQRFFVAYAQSFCANVRDEEARLHAATDPHAPYRARVNGVVVNMPEFAQAFKCAPKPAACSVW